MRRGAQLIAWPPNHALGHTELCLRTCSARLHPASLHTSLLSRLPRLPSHTRSPLPLSSKAHKAGADEALMLDPHGFVATCNSVNFFIVRGGEASNLFPSLLFLPLFLLLGAWPGRACPRQLRPAWPSSDTAACGADGAAWQRNSKPRHRGIALGDGTSPASCTAWEANKPLPRTRTPCPPKQVWAPTTKYQLHGITRQNTINLCAQQGIPVREVDFSLTKASRARSVHSSA